MTVPLLSQPDSSDTDAALARQAQAGDEAAFAELMQRHYEPVFRLVTSIVRNPQDARDLCQDIWLTVWRQLSRFRGEAKFSTWLHPIAVRRSLDHLRRRRRWFDRFIPFATAGDETSSGAPEPADPSDVRASLENQERQARFEQALASLPPHQRAVLALREIEGLSYEAIAQATQSRPGTVMSRLFHARRLLAQKLKDLPCD